MEAFDIKACNRFVSQYDKPITIISSIDYDGYEIKEILNNLSVLITSRYHARVLSLELEMFLQLQFQWMKDLKIFSRTSVILKSIILM